MNRKTRFAVGVITLGLAIGGVVRVSGIQPASAAAPPAYVTGTKVYATCSRWEAQAKGYVATATKSYDLTVTGGVNHTVLVHKTGTFTTGFAKLSGVLDPKAYYFYDVNLKVTGYAPEQLQTSYSAVDCPGPPEPKAAPAPKTTKAAPSTPAFKPYEATAFWLVDSGVDGPLFPQHRIAAKPQPQCNKVRIQEDHYSINTLSDENYLNGLKVLNSSADDQRLNPHDFSVTTIGGDKYCDQTSTPPSSTPPSSTPPNTSTPASSAPPATTTAASSPPARVVRRAAASSGGIATSTTVQPSPTPTSTDTSLASTGVSAVNKAGLSMFVVIAGLVLCLAGRRRKPTGDQPNTHR